MFRTAIVAVSMLSAVASCAAWNATQHAASNDAAARVEAAATAKPPCPRGYVIASVNESTPCDLVGGSNVLVLTDISAADCADAGGLFDGDDGCWHVDF